MLAYLGRRGRDDAADDDTAMRPRRGEPPTRLGMRRMTLRRRMARRAIRSTTDGSLAIGRTAEAARRPWSSRRRARRDACRGTEPRPRVGRRPAPRDRPRADGLSRRDARARPRPGGRPRDRLDQARRDPRHAPRVGRRPRSRVRLRGRWTAWRGRGPSARSSSGSSAVARSRGRRRRPSSDPEKDAVAPPRPEHALATTVEPGPPAGPRGASAAPLVRRPDRPDAGRDRRDHRRRPGRRARRWRDGAPRAEGHPVEIRRAAGRGRPGVAVGGRGGARPRSASAGPIAGIVHALPLRDATPAGLDAGGVVGPDRGRGRRACSCWPGPRRRPRRGLASAAAPAWSRRRRWAARSPASGPCPTTSSPATAASPGWSRRSPASGPRSAPGSSTSTRREPAETPRRAPGRRGPGRRRLVRGRLPRTAAASGSAAVRVAARRRHAGGFELRPASRS